MSNYIPQSNDIDDEFYKIYEMNAPCASMEIIPGLQAELKYFRQQKVGATGNILETARVLHKIFNPDENIASGEFLASITKMKDSPFAIEAFDNWLGSANEIFNINIYDLFHWEQKCGRWLSNNSLVFLMAWKEVFFPFNCRNLLIDFLSVSDVHRMPGDYQFFKDLIKNMWPDLLSEPINPQQKKGFLFRSIKKLKKIIALRPHSKINSQN